MPPEATPSIWQRQSLLDTLPAQWRRPLGLLGLAVVALSVVTLREWGEILHQWWNIDTYNHILIVPPIIAWLVYLKAKDLANMRPQTWLPGLALVAAGLVLWAVGRITEINLLAHAGAVGVMQAAVVTMLGLRISLVLALPIGFAVFLVPFGDEIIPQLQMITADIAIALTLWSGIPAVIDGIYIDTPVGLFIVAEACSGVKFLVAMVTLAVLVCFTRFESWLRRALFMLAAIIVPIIANGIRAWGTIYIAQSQGVEFAAGFDHIFYGWIFFAIVVVIVLAGAWRYFQSEPEGYGWTADEVVSWGWLDRLEERSSDAITGVSAVAALALIAWISTSIVAARLIG